MVRKSLEMSPSKSSCMSSLTSVWVPIVSFLLCSFKEIHCSRHPRSQQFGSKILMYSILVMCGANILVLLNIVSVCSQMSSAQVEGNLLSSKISSVAGARLFQCEWTIWHALVLRTVRFLDSASEERSTRSFRHIYPPWWPTSFRFYHHSLTLSCSCLVVRLHVMMDELSLAVYKQELWSITEFAWILALL